MSVKKLGDIFFLCLFGSIVLWLVVIPSYRMSGYNPFLNYKIHTVLNKQKINKVDLVYVSSNCYASKGVVSPENLDISIIDIIREIMMCSIVKDGYKRGTETETIGFVFFSNSQPYLSCKCSWDSKRKIMEVRFDDFHGNQKNTFYALNTEVKDKLFSYIEYNNK